jgi:hypothetical protein
MAENIELIFCDVVIASRRRAGVPTAPLAYFFEWERRYDFNLWHDRS